MGIYDCNYHDCGRKPYVEVFFRSEENESKWCYLCFWHYLWVRFFKRDSEGFCKVDTDREILEYIQQELWDIQSDLMDIKRELGIKPRIVYDEEKPEEKGFV